MGLFDNFFGKGNAPGSSNPYIRDFEIVEITDSKGRSKKKARYTGTWTIVRDESASRTKMVLVLVLSFLLACAYIGLLMTTNLVSGQLLIMLPLLIGLMPALYLLMGTTSLPFRLKPMRHDQYMHSFIRASRSSAAVAVCASLAMILSLGYRAVKGDWQFFQEDILFLILLAVLIAFSMAIIFILRSVDFAERPNEYVSFDASLF